MTSNWLALVLTLPTSPSAVRVRIWRSMKASGCGALRDGVYLLPDRPDCMPVFDQLADEVRQAAGEATLLQFAARDAEQQAQFEALFDRSAEYRDIEKEFARQRRELRTAAELPGRRVLRSLGQRLDALRGIDFSVTSAARASPPPWTICAWNAKRAGLPANRHNRSGGGSSGSLSPTSRGAPG